jgi:pyruvate formate lyase activating enzyme
MNPEAHQHWTGVDNQPILINLDMLAEMGKPFVIRVPLVPGVTDTNENLQAIAAHISQLPVHPPVELLPYNRAAGGKYAACGRIWHPAYDENAPVNANLMPFIELNLKVTLL